MNELSMIPAPQTLTIKPAENSYYGKLRATRTDSVPPQEIDPATIKNYDRIVEKAEEFEAVFIAEMLKPLMESVEVDPLFGGAQGEEVFRSIQIQEYGKKIAETNSIGIADFVKRELIRIQQETQS